MCHQAYALTFRVGDLDAVGIPDVKQLRIEISKWGGEAMDGECDLELEVETRNEVGWQAV